jgi:hypothetical protein
MDLENTLKQVKASFKNLSYIVDDRFDIHPSDFITAFICSVGNKQNRFNALADFRRIVGQYLGKVIPRTSFWSRISRPRFTAMLNHILENLLRDVGSIDYAKNATLIDQIGVQDVLLIDTSLLHLPNSAASCFPNTRHNGHALSAIKLHCCYSLKYNNIQGCALTRADVHDRNIFPAVKSLEKKLIIMDLGYYDFELFSQIEVSGGFFLSRVKKNANFKITKPGAGLSQYYRGRNILGIKSFRGEVIECFIGLNNKLKGRDFGMRAIGFWNPDTQEYHWYMTNLTIPAKVVYPLYQNRWQIELLFKSLKSSFHLNEIPSSNPVIVQNLILAGLISSVIASSVYQACLHRSSENASKEPQEKKPFSIQKSTLLFVTIAHFLFSYFQGNFLYANICSSIQKTAVSISETHRTTEKSSWEKLKLLFTGTPH